MPAESDRDRDRDRELALKLWVVLFRAQRAVGERLKDSVEAHDLTRSEFGVLEALLHKGDLTIGDLRNAVLLTSGSMTYVVDRLAEREFVERRACKADHRVTWVRLSAAGRRLIQKAFTEHATLLAEAMGGLTSAEKASAIELLKRLGKFAAQEASSQAG